MENNYFKEALKNFTYDVASGGAIEHLANLGYMPSQIHKMLDFPTPMECVQENYWKYCIKNKIIIEDVSEFSGKLEKTHFVTEYDEYGHKSFRKVAESGGVGGGTEPENFKTVDYVPQIHGRLLDFLKDYGCIGSAYVSCDYGARRYRDAEKFKEFLLPLTEEQRIYIEEMPWKLNTVWHVIDTRMAGILCTLYEKSSYHGRIMIPALAEKVDI